MQPFSWESHCPKCGAPNATVRYKQEQITESVFKTAQPGNYYVFPVAIGGPLTIPQVTVETTEYMQRGCQVCGYEWREAPLDSAEQKGEKAAE